MFSPRFGPLLWRSSKERKKCRNKKEVRDSKCSSADSGDSGIQLENHVDPNVNVTVTPATPLNNDIYPFSNSSPDVVS